MSLIIAANSLDGKFMAADKGAYYTETAIKMLSKNSKIMECEFKGEKYILGGVGSWFWVDTVLEGFYYFLEEAQFIDSWSLRKAMKTLMDDYDGDLENEATSEIMLLTKDTIYIIGSDGAATEPDKPYWAIGAAQGYAIGYLDGQASGISLSNTISHLFEQCSKYSIYVMPEYDIIEL